ncbi:helix-turn-helix domain-containing protein [Kitasatospora sp. NPDC092286]|uniref:helix-turn-helix domain-containing protein n=1 Tax=Kitasatospora sp. NPDC092286 TaxID=3364087 RepID=UPI00382ACADE
MGRRERAVAADTRELGALATWLREQRQRSGNITYKAMAEQTTYAPSMLSRAASGDSVPSLKVVEEYVRICGSDPRTARRYWRAARCAEQKRIRLQQELANLSSERVVGVLAVSLSAYLATRPQLIDSFGQLRWAMTELRAKEGQPSLAELQKRAGRRENGSNRLPASSLGAILRLQAVPRREHVTAFAQAMGVSEAMVEEWGAAWDRAAGRSVGTGSLGWQVPAQRSRAHQIIEVRIRPLPAGGLFSSAVGTEFTPEDIAFLRIHTPSDLRGIGPRRPLPPAGYTPAGLPIRVPRPPERLPGRRPQPQIRILIPREEPPARLSRPEGYP